MLPLVLMAQGKDQRGSAEALELKRIEASRNILRNIEHVEKFSGR